MKKYTIKTFCNNRKKELKSYEKAYGEIPIKTLKDFRLKCLEEFMNKKEFQNEDDMSYFKDNLLLFIDKKIS